MPGVTNYEVGCAQAKTEVGYDVTAILPQAKWRRHPSTRIATPSLGGRNIHLLLSQNHQPRAA